MRRLILLLSFIVPGLLGMWAQPAVAATPITSAAAKAATCTSAPFPDVPRNSTFCKDITWFKKQHITTGYADHKYHPKASVSRQAMAAFLYRLQHNGRKAPACTTPAFPDVPKSSTFCGDITWFKKQHITTGYADHKYHPKASVSRQAMAAFLYRLRHAVRKAPKCASAPFPDATGKSTFCGDIAWFKKQHITTGYADHKYHPKASVSRQAMAAFLYRLRHQLATTVLGTLPIRPKATMTDYDRQKDFGPAWTDDNGDLYGHNGCRTRDDILQRDLTHVVYKDDSTCTVASGTLHDPYTGKTINFVRGVGTSNAVQIDHVVALGNAWASGAKPLSMPLRVDLANDPLNLLAVDGPTNEAKGDDNAAEWLPPKTSFRCAYVARQIAVKAKYSLWVTSAEKSAMTHVLGTCAGQLIPVVSGDSGSGDGGSGGGGSGGGGAKHPVKEFANCSEMHMYYPHGVGKSGAVDKTSGTPDTEFFVSNKVYQLNTKSDRDKDGIACES